MATAGTVAGKGGAKGGKGGKGPKGKSKGGGGKLRPLSLPQQAARAARLQTQASMAPVEQQISAEKAANLARAQAQMGFSKAAASIMQAAAPAVSNLYSGAANADAGYARGLGNVAQSAVDQQAASNNAFLKSMGTPTAGLETAAPIGDISYGLHGYIPATTLQREGAAFGSAAQLAPENVLNQGQQLAGSTLAYDKNLSDLQGELGKIAATEPATYQDILKGYQDAAYKQNELGLRAAELQSTAAYHQAEIGLSAQRIKLEAAKAAQTQLDQNRSYRISLAHLGLEGKRLQLEATKQEISLRNGGLSPSEVSRYHSEAMGLSMTAFQSQDTATKKPITFKQALAELTTRGIPPSIAIDALHHAGFRPGVRGTPMGLSPAAGNGASMFDNLGGILGGAFGGAAGGAQTAAEKTIVGLAHDYIGTPYVWGGESPKGFDCSGLAQYIYGKAGVNIPRTTYAQWHAGHAVPKNQLQPGDLVFFRGSDPGPNGEPGHVGIYVGNGRMIDSPHTGASVEMDSVTSFGGYVGARRY